MKNIQILTLIITFSTFYSFAQDEGKDYRNSLVFGFKGGLNYSNVYDEQGEDFRADGKAGLVGGAFVGIPLGTLLGIHAEFLISQKGFKSSGKILGLPYVMTRTTTFIDVPLFVAIKPVSFLTILAGPQFSYLIKKRDRFESAIVTSDQVEVFKNENYRNNTFSLAFGADINIKHLVIGARAAWDISKNNGDGTSTTPRYKNVWFQGTIGYRL
jgi:hypothetical protein